MEKPGSTIELLEATAVATVATVLHQIGIKSVWLRGPRPVVIGQRRIAGPAFTLRFIPSREDIPTAESVTGPSSPRAVLEKIPQGSVVVADAMGSTGAGVFGDIVCARMKYLGIAGFVTDGPIRDLAALTKLDWPIWADGTAAPPSPAALHCVGSQVPVACGETAVFPGDIIVGGDDGVVVIPAAMADEVAQKAYHKDRFEEWVCDQVLAGASLDGLYPPNEETQKRYEASLG